MSRRDPRKYPLTLPNIKSRPTLKELGLTLVYAFYNNEEKRLAIQWHAWKSYPESILEKLHVVLVDDGSKVPLNIPKPHPLDLSIYRIKEDIKWNTPGALNLGVLQAPTDWVLTLDSDCILDCDAITRLMTDLSPVQNSVYYFERTKRIYQDKVVYRRYHPCASLMYKATFQKIGGFDEDFVGARSGGYAVWDRDFEDRITKTPDKFHRTSIMNVDITEFMPDVTGGTVQPKDVQDKFDINLALMRDKGLGRKPRNRKLLNFKWEKYDLR